VHSLRLGLGAGEYPHVSGMLPETAELVAVGRHYIF